MKERLCCIFLTGLFMMAFMMATMPSVWAADQANWGLTYRNGANQPPSGPSSVETLAQYGAYYMGDPNEKLIYLTFDCGYENGNTAPILDTLKKHHAPAAFFVVSHFLDTAPDLAKRMGDEGHLVCNHTSKHPNMTKVSSQRFSSELLDVAAQYQQITGRRLAPFYRPPEGAYSISNLQQAQSLGYHTTLWSVAYADWDPKNQPSRESALNTLNSRVHNGALVLLHAVSSTNASGLDELLTQWEQQGYTFEALSSLPGIPDPTVTARPNDSAFAVDGNPTALCAYQIKDNNYIKLRDLAAALKDSNKQFSVHYEQKSNLVNLSTGQAYAVAGGELSGPADVAAMQARSGDYRISVDNQDVNLTTYAIEGSNYIKLRDLAEKIDFGVNWNSTTQAIDIDTTVGYRV